MSVSPQIIWHLLKPFAIETKYSHVTANSLPSEIDITHKYFYPYLTYIVKTRSLDGFKENNMNVNVTEKQKNYISSLVASGDYQNASEAVRDALRLHQQYREKLIDDLRLEIEKGWAGETSQRSIQDIIESRTK